MICYSIVAVAGLTMFCLILFKKNFKFDCFLISLSVLIMLAGLCYVPIEIAYKWTTDDLASWIYTMANVGDFSQSLVDWIFPIMILRSAMNVSLLFGEEIDEIQKK